VNSVLVPHVAEYGHSCAVARDHSRPRPTGAM
jgi:hypothetical protein